MKLDVVFEGMFGVIFFYYLLSQAFATIMPTATAVTIWGINVTFIITIAVIGVVLLGGYKLVKSTGWK
jgi:hypothetical protein